MAGPANIHFFVTSTLIYAGWKSEVKEVEIGPGQVQNTRSQTVSGVSHPSCFVILLVDGLHSTERWELMMTEAGEAGAGTVKQGAIRVPAGPSPSDERSPVLHEPL